MLPIIQRSFTPALSHFVGEGARIVRAYFTYVLTALVLIAFCSLSPVSNAQLKNLTVLSYPDRPAKLPLWLAQEAGLFKKYGLNVDIKTPELGRGDR